MPIMHIRPIIYKVKKALKERKSIEKKKKHKLEKKNREIIWKKEILFISLHCQNNPRGLKQ